MANSLDLKVMLKHLSNGTLGENLCIICLSPLQDQYENIFTEICKQDKNYCIADVLQTMCQITLSESDNYNACINCFMMASMAHKFYLLSKRSHEILEFYSDQVLNNLDQIQIPEESTNDTLCLSLPEISTETPIYDYNLHGIGKKGKKKVTNIESDQKPVIVKEVKQESAEDDVVVIIKENDESMFYKVNPDGGLELVNDLEKDYYKVAFANELPSEKQPKRRRKRGPMTLKLCTRCPVKYRFAAKLKEHMKLEHKVDLFVCKVCKAMTEDEQEYHNHLKTHTNIHQCALCNMVFKKRDTIINHLKWHEKMRNISQAENAHICEICGVILENEDGLKQHYENKHYKKFTCYYCGRMYKGEMSFDMHIKKHEANMEMEALKKKQDKQDASSKTQKAAPEAQKQEVNKKKCMCSTCGRDFVDERSLMWHQRLHNNERPYNCDVCGRGFVSLNRRNQHALCAHTAPTRRCPLCPALFHLRSMINTHIKKVHLKAHKRRNRISKHQNVYWRTEAVPIQELSVDIQNDILELQAANNEQDWTFLGTSSTMEIEEEI
ncbi:zinc finger protein 684-like [Trichoplusia ni]|uniref:Zinc finger protein 684-like n=1 Tax=Trichoplusia ni TaxID=7111 RepID=A0A7E5WS42_TRINI|nr:zinc finger protein 684-like [Trichoplusia ni]XP_026743430.1 zinc finger protein 684-like [Trichoplusia ni]XP_026743431.1 zinc finger protein 684-like [Trichoplusia ni]